MNKYDRDMMHERELIHDAKGQIHKADEAYKKGDKGKKQEMIHDREMIHDAKKDIHGEDIAKYDEDHGHNSSVHKALKHSWRNKGINFDSSTDRGISTLYTGERQGE